MTARSAEGMGWGGALVLLLLSAAVASCGDLTAGGSAEAEVFMTGNDASQTSSGPAAAHGASPSSRTAGPDAASSPGGGDSAAFQAGDAPLDQLNGGALFQGTVDVRARVFLERAGGVPILISRDQEVLVDIQGEVPVSLGTSTIPPGLYRGVRVVFTRVEADVTSGLGPPPHLGAGIVQVDLGGASLSVEHSVNFTVRDDERLVVTVNLRAPAWIQTVALTVPRIVSGSVFRDLVEIVPRTQ